jgi:hypothetical protein
METREESFTSDFVVCMEMPAWVSALSEGGWNIFKDGNTDTGDQSRCGRPRTAATERNKQKVDEVIRQDRRITVREIAPQLGVGHHAVQEMMAILGYRKLCSVWFPVSLWVQSEHNTAGNCSPIHPTIWIWPSSVYLGPLKDHLRGHHYQTDEAVQEAVRSWLRGAGTDFYRRGSFNICNAGRNA